MFLLIRTPVLLNQVSILMISFNLDDLRIDSISKYSHIGGLVFQHMNFGSGDTIPSISGADRRQETPGSETKDNYSKPSRLHKFHVLIIPRQVLLGLNGCSTPSDFVSWRRKPKPREPQSFISGCKETCPAFALE